MLVLLITHKAVVWFLRQALSHRFLHRYSLPMPRPLPPPLQRQHSRETVIACTQQLARQLHQFQSVRRRQRLHLQSLQFSCLTQPPSIQYFQMAILVVKRQCYFHRNLTSPSSFNLSSCLHTASFINSHSRIGLVNIQQFGGGAISLPNGTVATGTGTAATTLSGLVIHQPQQKMVVTTANPQQTTMIIPAKVAASAGTTVVGQQQHQQQQQQTTVLGTNGTALNQSQVLRPATQVVQQHQQGTVINSAGAGILPAGVQVVNMNAMRPQTVQNMAALNNPAHRALAPRVVLAPQQMVGARPGQMGITLQALQVTYWLISFISVLIDSLIQRVSRLRELRVICSSKQRRDSTSYYVLVRVQWRVLQLALKLLPQTFPRYKM